MPKRKSLTKNSSESASVLNAHVQEALYDVALDLINRRDLNEILDRLLVKCAELLKAPSVSIDLLEGENMIVTYAATPDQPLKVGDRMRRGEGGHLSWQAVDTRKPVVLDDYSTWAKRRSLYDKFPIRAILIIPIIHREKVIGNINFLRFVNGKTFTKDEVFIAGRLCQAAALVLDNARVYEQLKAEIDEHKRVEAELRNAQTKIAEEEQTLAILRERERLARDLHDGVGQLLGYVSMQADIANHQIHENDMQGAEQTLSKLTEATQQVNREMRQYILDLTNTETSTKHQDFFSALQEYCQQAVKTHQFKIYLRLPSPLPKVLASPEVETQLTYIVDEALHNARKHSSVLQAFVTIDVDDKYVKAIVEDHGKGLGGTYKGPERRKSTHFGMGIMRSRAEEVGGSLQIETSPSTGTRITVTLPRQLEDSKIAAGQLRILLADDHPLFIDGVRSMLMQQGVQVVGVAKDGIEAQEMARNLRPDMILMDINMPHVSGLEATRAIKSEIPDIKIIMLTTSTREDDLFSALSAGASGYLLKGMGVDEFMTLLSEISAGEASFSSDMASRMLEIFARADLKTSSTQPEDPLAVLTDRQRDVLSLVSQGLTYKEVGQKLFLTERTVKFHMGEILKRLQVKGRQALLKITQKKSGNSPAKE